MEPNSETTTLQKEDTDPQQTLEQNENDINSQNLSKKETIEEKLQSRLESFYNDYYLSSFQRFAVTKFIKDNIADKENKKVDRVRDWLFHKLNKSKPDISDAFQRGCPDVVPGLTGKPWWDKESFTWMKVFEDNYEVIKEELLGLRKLKGFQPYRGPSWISNIKAKDGVGNLSNDSGEWNVFYLFLHDMKFEENCAKCPKTVELIEKYLPRHYQHAFFSAVTPGTHIMKHNGPTNKKLRLHLPLVGVKGSCLRVADEKRYQEAGKCYVFDDSFEHEAWHDGDEARIILIADFWHPDLTNDEVKFLNLIQKARMKYERSLSEKDPDNDNFYSIIDISRDLLKSNDWWTSNEEDLIKTSKIEETAEKNLLKVF